MTKVRLFCDFYYGCREGRYLNYWPDQSFIPTECFISIKVLNISILYGIFDFELTFDFQNSQIFILNSSPQFHQL